MHAVGRTKIEWCTDSWNPIRARGVAGKIGWHCEHVSEGCRFCYAEAINRRLGTGLEYKPGYRDALEIFLDEKTLLQPLKWKKPRRVFVCSMTDLFADFVSDEMIDRIFAVMALCPQHQFQVLTKRSARMRAYCSTIQKYGRWLSMEDVALQLGRDPRGADNDGFDWLAHKEFLPNVWLGVSCEDQKRADERIPDLLQTPAAIRFVSLEPLLGPIDLKRCGSIERPERGVVQKVNPLSGFFAPDAFVPRLDWVIAGGESGPNARPMHPDSARSIRDQCEAAGVPFFFKQWGEWADADDYALETQEHFDARGKTEGKSIRVGKRAAGRLLDGREHSEYPACERE
jgi:protein gp37